MTRPPEKHEEPWRDPIIEELHAVRQELFERCGGTLEAYFEYLKQVEKEAEAAGHPIWRGEPKADAGKDA